MVALSRPVSSTKLGLSWATESRILLRVSRITRVLTLTRLDTPTLGVLGGVSGLHTLDGPNRASAKNVRESSGKSSNRNKASKGQISPHTQPTTPFPSGCSLLTRIQDDSSRMIRASLSPRAWVGLLRFRLGSLGAGGSSANSGCDFGSTFTSFETTTMHSLPSFFCGEYGDRLPLSAFDSIKSKRSFV